jgi:beta-galactosidase/beta-glucuronidase
MEHVERLLESSMLAHMNMLRIWGGGLYHPEWFYDMADRFGILLMHGMMDRYASRCNNTYMPLVLMPRCRFHVLMFAVSNYTRLYDRGAA